MTLGFRSALVTGGAGFIGSHLADALVEAGCRVTVLDNLSTGNMSNIAHIRDRITFIQGDIREDRALDRAMEGCEMVFHEAAVVSVVQTVDDPVGSARINEMGTLQLLETARRHGIRRTVLASSAAVYGDAADVPNQERMTPEPKSPYAVQKLTNELYARNYHALYGLETVCLRYFNVFGPRQDPSSPYSGVISIFMAKAVERSRPVIYGDGTQYRDFVFVRDVVRANLLAAVAPRAAGSCINIGTGSSVTINRLWTRVSALSGFDAAPAYGPPRPGDIVESVSDIGRADRILGYRPEFDFDTGLALTFDGSGGSGN